MEADIRAVCRLGSELTFTVFETNICFSFAFRILAPTAVFPYLACISSVLIYRNMAWGVSSPDDKTSFLAEQKVFSLVSFIACRPLRCLFRMCCASGPLVLWKDLFCYHQLTKAGAYSLSRRLVEDSENRQTSNLHCRQPSSQSDRFPDISATQDKEAA